MIRCGVFTLQKNDALLHMKIMDMIWKSHTVRVEKDGIENEWEVNFL